MGRQTQTSPAGGNGGGKTIVPYKERVANVRTMLTANKEQIRLALPRHMNPDRMARIVMTSVQRTPELLECTPQSLFGAVVQSAQLGLEPDGVLGHAYLIPFWNGKKGVREVQFMPGYKGLVDLARRSGKISVLFAQVVHAKDEFEYCFGLEPTCVHRPTREEDAGAVIAAYAVAHLSDGGRQFEVMLVRELEAIRKGTRERNSGKESPAWRDHTEEMYKKTVLRRLCKLLPASVEMQRAVALDERAELGIPQELDAILDVDSEPAAVEGPEQTPESAAAGDLLGEGRT